MVFVKSRIESQMGAEGSVVPAVGQGSLSLSPSLTVTLVVRLLVVVIALPTVTTQNNAPSGTTSPPTMSSGAMIGIIIAGICLLLIVIGSIVLFLICRKLGFQNKPNDTAERERQRRDQLDLRSLQDAGCGLPVDIPVEALGREPPPRYASIENLTPESSSVSGHRRTDVAIIGEHPPPYSTVSRSGVVALDHRADFRSAPFLGGYGRSNDSPPLYQSRVNLDVSHLSMPEYSTIHADTSGPALPPLLPLHAGSVAANQSRLHSVGSFRDIPNMSDVLLTSSRTSLPTSASAAAAVDAAVPSTDAVVAVRGGRPRQPTASSARLESTTSGRSAASGVGTVRTVGRSTSSDEAAVAVTHGASSDRRQEQPGDNSSQPSRRTRRNMQPSGAAVDDAPVSVHSSSISTTTTSNRRRTAVDATVETVNQPRSSNRGRQATRSRPNDSTDDRLSSVEQSDSATSGVVAADITPSVGGSQHRRRNNTKSQRHEQRATQLISQSLPRLTSVDEEQQQTRSTSSSSTMRLDLAGYGSVV